MTWLAVRNGWVLLPVYVAAGFVLGVADPALGRWAGQLGYRPGVATAVSVNLLLPLVALGLALAAPRLRTAWLGALALAIGFFLGLAVAYPPDPPHWTAAALLAGVRPVLMLACLGYGVVGSLTALLVRRGKARA
jgi:hypothetical protein